MIPKIISPMSLNRMMFPGPSWFGHLTHNSIMAGNAIPRADKQNAPNSDMKSPSRGIVSARITEKNGASDLYFQWTNTVWYSKPNCNRKSTINLIFHYSFSSSNFEHATELCQSTMLTACESTRSTIKNCFRKSSVKWDLEIQSLNNETINKSGT